MRKFAKRLSIIGASVAATAAISAPSAQAATNPYTPQAACSNDFGGSWSYTTDGHRDVVNPFTGAKYGDVYLMYNSSTGKNCVVTIKGVAVGVNTNTLAQIWVQTNPETTYYDSGSYKYYAAVQTYARGLCVDYSGGVYAADGSTAYGSRGTYGNCG